MFSRVSASPFRLAVVACLVSPRPARTRYHPGMWNPFRRRRPRVTLHTILERLDTMSQQLDSLKAAVAAEATVIDSAIALINGLAAQIAALPADEAAIAQLATDVKAKSDALATAVTVNTPAT